MTLENLDVDGNVLKCLAFCSSLLTFKILGMAPLIARLRYAKGLVISPEDVALVKNGKVGNKDPEIERVRRAHRNDLENIPIFIAAAFLYAFTKPNPLLAVGLFVVYTIARFAHTYVYAVSVKPQPARFLAFVAGALVTLYMSSSVIYHLA